MRTAILVVWPKGRVIKGKHQKPEVAFYDRLDEANRDFKQTIKDELESELWESGLGITRRHSGGRGKINFKGGLQFHEGLKKALAEAQKPATTIDRSPAASGTKPAKETAAKAQEGLSEQELQELEPEEQGS